MMMSSRVVVSVGLSKHSEIEEWNGLDQRKLGFYG